MADMKKVATRDSYGAALAALGAEHPDLVVLDADLAGAEFQVLNFSVYFRYNRFDIFRADFLQRDASGI